MLANEKSKGMGDQEEGMDLADEVDMGGKVNGILFVPQMAFRSLRVLCIRLALTGLLFRRRIFGMSCLSVSRCVLQCISKFHFVTP